MGLLADIPLGIVVAIAACIILWACIFSYRSGGSPKRHPLLWSTVGMIVTFGLIAWALAGFGTGLWTTLPPVAKIFVVSIMALWAYVFFYRFTSVTVANAPTVLTTFGIFGTFVGIAWGLSGFNAADIQGSVPTLLDGLRTSFWSSIVGIGGAVAIKVKHLIIVSIAEEEDIAGYGATIDDLASLLRTLNKSLTGTEESTVVDELMHSRQDSNDRLDGLRRSFDEFTKDLVAKLNEQDRQLHEHVATRLTQTELPQRTS